MAAIRKGKGLTAIKRLLVGSSIITASLLGAGGGGGGTPAVNSVAPSISGSRGGTLTATAGTWVGATSVAGQWYADGVATGNTTLSFSDTDTSKTLEYRETAFPGSVTASAWDGTVANVSTNSWNPSDKNGTTLSNSNTTADLNTNVAFVRSILGLTGKDYAEFHIDSKPGTAGVGVVDATETHLATNWAGDSDSLGVSATSNGDVHYSAFDDGAGFAFAAGDVIGVYLDKPNGKVYFQKNGVDQLGGNPAASTGGKTITNTGTLMWVAQAFGGEAVITARFAPSSWQYTPATGYGGTATSATVATNAQSSGVPGQYQLDISGSTNDGSATGLQYKVEGPNGALIQTWTNMTFAGGSGTAAFLVPQWTYEGQALRVLVRNVGGASSIVSVNAPVIPYALQQPMLIGLNDGFWNYWSTQSPGRDIFEPVTLHPSDSMDLVSTSLAASHKDGILPPGMVFPDYAHWNEAYSPTQLYPATSTSSDDNYLVCVYNGVNWRRTDHTPRSGVAPDPTDPTGATSGWIRDYFADGSVVGMDARGMPTKLPDDTNLTIRFTPAWSGFKPSRYPVTVHVATEPGVKFTLYNPVNVSQANVNLAAGTFDLIYTGDGGVKLVIDRTGGPISSAFFLSGVPSYETGAPAADIGSPYPSVDKIADFQPFHAMRNMSAQPTNRTTTATHNGMTAANSVPTGGRRLWKYDVDMANAQDNWLIANGHGHASIWVNVQDNADDTYMDAMAAYYRDHLNAGITVFLELGNERWNLGFTPARELFDRATALGIGNHQLHARESVAMAGRWRTVFGGSASRVKLVLNWQTVAAEATWEEMLDFENAYLSTDYIAHAPYWGTNGYADYSAGTTAAVSANDYAAFVTAADTMMRSYADGAFAITKSFYNWLPGYSVSKGLSKNAIKLASYEGGSQMLINQGEWDTNLGAGMGARANTFVGNYKRSATHAATYAYWLDKMATQTPHIYMAFDYNGTAVGWAHMDRMGNQADEPYATLKSKALLYN